MPDRTDDPVNPIKWYVRLAVALLLLFIAGAVWVARNGWPWG